MVERLKKELATDPDFLIKKTEEMLVNNDSRVYLKMIADKDYESKQADQEAKLLAECLATFQPQYRNR